MKPYIRPIETHYKGYRFRSRLEARWAVYMDAAGIQWEYEPEGYELGGGFRYLPDFYLPQVNMFAEVKPTRLTRDELEKAWRLVRGTGSGCVFLIGTPKACPYPCIFPDGLETNCFFSSYHDYLTSEGRFYVSCHVDDLEEVSEEDAIDYCLAEPVLAARSARFEHGESASWK